MNKGGQDLPTRFKSELMILTRYRRISDAFLEVAHIVLNFGQSTFDWINIPWGGVRSTVFKDLDYLDGRTFRRLGQRLEFPIADPALAPGDFFGAGNLQSLPPFEGLDELARLEHRFVGAGVEPSVAAAHDFDAELALFQVMSVDIGNFEFSPGGRLDRLGDIDNVVVVEVRGPSLHNVISAAAVSLRD